MEIASRAFEMTGTVDTHRHLLLDDALPIKGPRKVRVIILMPEEDIYSINDGKPFNDNK